MAWGAQNLISTQVNDAADARIEKKEKAKSLPYGGDPCINQIVATRLRLDGVPLGCTRLTG